MADLGSLTLGELNVTASTAIAMIEDRASPKLGTDMSSEVDLADFFSETGQSDAGCDSDLLKVLVDEVAKLRRERKNDQLTIERLNNRIELQAELQSYPNSGRAAQNATLIQKAGRGHASRTRFERARSAAVFLQKMARGRTGRVQRKNHAAAAARMQAAYRRHSCAKKYTRCQEAILNIQSAARRRLSVCCVGKMKCTAAVIMQRQVRAYLSVVRLGRTKTWLRRELLKREGEMKAIEEAKKAIEVQSRKMEIEKKNVEEKLRGMAFGREVEKRAMEEEKTAVEQKLRGEVLNLKSTSCDFFSLPLPFQDRPQAQVECFIWKVHRIDLRSSEDLYSPKFSAKGYHEWKINLCPNGNGEDKGTHLAMFLDAGTRIKMNVTCRLGILNVLGKAKHETIMEDLWFWEDQGEGTFGSRQLITLASIRDPTQGWLTEDDKTLTVFAVIEKATKVE